jgi:hypothetical protein
MNFKNIVLGIGIVIIFGLVLWQGIEAFYPSPQYNNYCSNVKVPQPVTTDVKNLDISTNSTYCLENNGTWQNGYCDYYFECQKALNKDLDAHSKIVFFISLTVALLVFIIGFLILNVEPVGSALLGSGIWAIFYGSVVNWRNISSIWRFLLLFVALVLLIFIAIRLNRPNKKKKFWKFWE